MNQSSIHNRKQRTDPKNQERELGSVSWYRNYHQAIVQSETDNKPILLLFQEIPGCSTCVNFGQTVLSNPLMTEAIENEFIPLAIHNNKEGHDREILNKYNEATWNNPVVYFIDSNGEPIIPKLANNYNPYSLYLKMLEALRVSNKKIPAYFQLLGDDFILDTPLSKRTVYETPCFWSGETSFAQKEGVISTEAGWIGHKEVVELYINPKLVSENEIDVYAKQQGFYPVEKHNTFRTDKDPQYYLKQTDYKYLPLSKSQKTKINLAIPYRKDPSEYLSPKQKTWLQNLSKYSNLNPNTYMGEIENTWKKF